MWPLLIPVALAGGAVCWAVKKLDKSTKEYSERVRKAGGEKRINSIRLYSKNYKGKIPTKGNGISVTARDSDKEDGEFELKLKAAEAGCSVIKDYEWGGSRKDGLWFEGTAYKQ